MRRTRTAIALPVMVVAAATIAAQSAVDERIHRIENGLVPPVVLKGQPIPTSKLEDRMRELNTPGVSVAVFANGRIEWARGWGMADVAAGRRVDAETRFQAASISKPVAAATALALVSSGRMSLDQDINTYLTSWKLPETEFTAKQKITLRHLLSHTGGVTVSGFPGYASTAVIPTLVQLLDGAKPANTAPVRVDIPVASRWRYAGGGFEIVQLAIEDVTKKPFADVARDLVLVPLGMSHSTYVQPIPAALRDKAATAYGPSGEPVAGRFHTYPEQAAAGLWTTPEDLARFAIAVQQMAAGTSTRPIMSRELANEMLKPVLENYGLGLQITGTGRETRFGHGGSNEGFRCMLTAFKDVASGVVVMVNSERGGAILEPVARAVAREYGWPGLAPIERTLGTADPSTYRDFAGRYELPVRSPPVILSIETDGGKLFGDAAGNRLELLPESAAAFFALSSDVRIQFVRDASGKVTEARVSQGGVEHVARRLK
jgi:CubicO group peptidase (beta-lactamase class C family)